MARKNGYADFAPIAVNSSTLASQLLAEDVTVVETSTWGNEDVFAEDP